MELTVRQGKILNRIVQEYIELAQPISSQLLERKYDFGICPATIRIEMQKLTKGGFLYQPHTSAGRIPTDKGYRFFVDNLFEKGFDGLGFFDDFELEDWVERIDDAIKFIQFLTKNLALFSQALTLSYLEKEKIFLKEGWEKVLKEPEFEEKEYLIDFTKFLEDLEKEIESLVVNSGIKIYIGEENPLKSARNFSIISSRVLLPTDSRVIISLLGPKRMAYYRNISLINSLVKFFEK